MKTRLKLTDIRLIWGRVKPELEQLRERYALDWKAEDVYAYCLMGKAFCWADDNGFYIVRPHENPFNLQQELFVWIVISYENQDLFDEYLPDIYAIAESINAKRVVFESPRPAFSRIAKSRGWPCMSTYIIPN